MFFVRDPAAIAAAKGWGPVAPFYIEQELPCRRAAGRGQASLCASLPNNHMQYAVTWYGLALVLTVSFAIWAFKSGRTKRRET